MTTFLRRGCIFLVTLFLGGCVFDEPPIQRYIEYPVRKGDSLYEISDRFEVHPREIINLNNIVPGRALSIGAILRIPYNGQKIEKRSRDIMTGGHAARSPDNESVRLVGLSGAKRYVGKLVWPVSGAAVSSPFGKRWLSFHEGIDLRAQEGRPIFAAHDGDVVYSGDGLRGYGNLVILKTEGLLTVYSHNRKNLVKVGDRVSKGFTIAYVGQSGKATGPHLHFETRVKNKQGKNMAVDPLAFYSKR